MVGGGSSSRNEIESESQNKFVAIERDVQQPTNMASQYIFIPTCEDCEIIPKMNVSFQTKGEYVAYF